MRRAAALLLSALVLAPACSSPTYLLEGEELQRFLAAGPALPELDQDAVMREIRRAGPYRVAPGDLLEVRAPAALFASSAAPGSADAAQLARVDAEGRCQLPLGISVPAAGHTLMELEAAVTAAVYPKFLVDRPAIVVRVVEHARVPVTVIGAVELPGIHELRSDQMNLYGALTEAGGVVKSNNLVVGAGLIRIRRPGSAADDPVLLPVKGLNIPFANVALEGGETIEVVRFEPDTFSLVGLVNKPGAFAYPPEVSYNLMQALAVAGGVDTFANPPYATVFRKDRDGNILPATFEINGDGLVYSSNLQIKPGDVIVVGHTAASWTRALIREIFRVQVIFGEDSRD
ncbi:MAG TPA: polysaccharide biosynthesis/export family protein [Planctomycetota bacterium]|nr:polysaccharide biosynthesis/export family protein [Planctomycetota bacterium]